MNKVIQITLITGVLTFPIVFFLLYLNAMNKRTKKVIQNYSDTSSKLYKDLNVWVKDFDILRNKNKFHLDPNQTLYSYNYCDLIFNERNFIVIGKATFFGKYRQLTPTIFELENKNTKFEPQKVKIESIQNVGNDLEIDFIDDNYLDKMTLVIKQPDAELKEKIKKLAITANLYKNG